MRTRGAHSWVRNTPDRLARLHQQRLVVLAASLSVRTIASKLAQSRAARPVPP